MSLLKTKEVDVLGRIYNSTNSNQQFAVKYVTANLEARLLKENDFLVDLKKPGQTRLLFNTPDDQVLCIDTVAGKGEYVFDEYKVLFSSNESDVQEKIVGIQNMVSEYIGEFKESMKLAREHTIKSYEEAQR